MTPRYVTWRQRYESRRHKIPKKLLWILNDGFRNVDVRLRTSGGTVYMYVFTVLDMDQQPWEMGLKNCKSP